MRKSISKKTVIVVLALFLCLSVGYALFSDTITIEGTATAQGEFKVDKVCSPGIDSALSVSASDLYGSIDEENGYAEDYCNITSNGIEFGTELSYPGALRAFTLKITNNNDYTIKLDDESVEQNLTKILDGTEYDCDTSDGETMCKAIDVWSEVDSIYFIADGETQEAESFNIEPGDTMYMVFKAFWDPVDDGELTNGKEVSSKLNMNFDLIQVVE